MTITPFDAATEGSAAEDVQPLLGAFRPELVPELAEPDFVDPDEVEVGVSPDSSFDVLENGLRSAADTLLIYIYNLTGDGIIDIIRQRIEAGVSVRILYDVNDLRGEERAKMTDLAKAGANVVEAPSTGPRSVFSVCHQKLAVIDDSQVLVGSANWGPSGYPADPDPLDARRTNREWVARIAHRGLAQWYVQLFEADWTLATRATHLDAPFNLGGEPLEPVFLPLAAKPTPPPGPFPALALASTDEDPVSITPVTSPTGYLDRILALIGGAKTSICIQQQYIYIPGAGIDALLAKVAERRAAGVDVQIMVSPAYRRAGKIDGWEKSVDTLARHGLDDCLRALNTRVFQHLHNKGVLVDDEAAVVSSTNWSENSVAKAREAGVIIRSKRIAGYFRSVFDADWKQGWPAADVKPNIAALFEEAAFRPGGFQETPAGEFA